MAKQQASLVKYINAIKQSPREIYNRHLFISVVAFALGGCAKGITLSYMLICRTLDVS